MAWTQPDYGAPPTGEIIRSLPIDGRPEPITKRVTRAEVAGDYRLPDAHSQPIECWFLNRSGGLTTVLPGPQGRIEANEVGVGIPLAPGEAAVFWLFETSITPPPRMWSCTLYRIAPPDAAEHAQQMAAMHAEHAAALAVVKADAAEAQRQAAESAINEIMAAILTRKGAG